MSANSAFEAQYYDEYDYYNIEDSNQLSNTSRKGRTKAEAGMRRYVFEAVYFDVL